MGKIYNVYLFEFTKPRENSNCGILPLTFQNVYEYGAKVQTVTIFFGFS